MTQVDQHHTQQSQASSLGTHTHLIAKYLRLLSTSPQPLLFIYLKFTFFVQKKTTKTKLSAKDMFALNVKNYFLLVCHNVCRFLLIVFAFLRCILKLVLHLSQSILELAISSSKKNHLVIPSCMKINVFKKKGQRGWGPQGPIVRCAATRQAVVDFSAKQRGHEVEGTIVKDCQTRKPPRAVFPWNCRVQDYMGDIFDWSGRRS